MLFTSSSNTNIYLPIVIILIWVNSVSAKCHYDPLSGRTTCNGLSHGARLSIGAAISIFGAILVTALAYLSRRIYRSRQTQNSSARNHGQTQPRTEITPCPSNATPNVACLVYNPDPFYHAPPLPVPLTQERDTYGAPPPGYASQASETQSRPGLTPSPSQSIQKYPPAPASPTLSQKYPPEPDPPLEPHPYEASSDPLTPHPYSTSAQRALNAHPYAASRLN
ncbi:hypothetical protein DFH28DRAFT_1125216 [Melampsora americana]|nr:hypothetical protein DFH28DRAFT_1125216 [Melampsora americana]